MREVQNKTTKDLSFDEHKALIEAAELLQKAFGWKIWACFINPDAQISDEVFSIVFTMDTRNVR